MFFSESAFLQKLQEPASIGGVCTFFYMFSTVFSHATMLLSPAEL